MLLPLLLACQPTAPDSFGGAPSDGGAESTTPADLSELVAEVAQDREIPALGGAALSSEGLLGLGVSGLRRSDDADLVTPADLWHLGSDTKAMTATLLALAVDEGLLGWETTVAQAFPELAVDPAWDSVSLEALMQHRGGADSSLAQDHPEIWSGLWARQDGCAAREWFVEQLLADPPSETVGQYVYSNAGYIIIGAALEQATGTCWQDHIRDRLFQPLAMDDCGFGAPQGDQPWGHTQAADGSLDPVDPTSAASDNPPGLGPAGTVHCSLQSWAAFAALHLRAARGQPELVSADGFDHLHTPNGSYAGGWGVSQGDRGLTLTHAGSNTMWYALITIEVEQDRAWLMTTNAATTAAQRAVNSLQGALVEHDAGGAW